MACVHLKANEHKATFWYVEMKGKNIFPDLSTFHAKSKTFLAFDVQ